MRHIKYLLTGIAAVIGALLLTLLGFGAVTAFFWLVRNQPLIIIVPGVVLFCYLIGADIYKKDPSDAHVPARRQGHHSHSPAEDQEG